MSAQETCISANVCSWPRGFHSTVCRRRSRRGCIRGNHARSCLSRRFAHTKLWQRHGGNTRPPSQRVSQAQTMQGWEHHDPTHTHTAPPTFADVLCPASR